MTYPTELIAQAEYEMKIFERCGSITCQNLINEVKKLRAIIETSKKAKVDEYFPKFVEYFPGDTKPRLTQEEIQRRLQAFWDSNEQDWSVFSDIPESQQVNVMYPHRIGTLVLGPKTDGESK
jgi:hypothetical protein